MRNHTDSHNAFKTDLMMKIENLYINHGLGIFRKELKCSLDNMIGEGSIGIKSLKG